MYKIIKNGKNQNQRRSEMTLTKIKIWRTILFVIIVFCINNVYGETARREGVPWYPQLEMRMINAVQTDGTKVNIMAHTYPNGYIRYGISSGHTVIFDEKSENWCYAQQSEDGWIESTGYPIHLHSGNEAGVKPSVRPSKERMEEFEQNQKNESEQTRRFNAPWRKMPSIAPENNRIESLVIYVLLNDIALTDTVFVDVGRFNGDAPALSAQRYFKEMSNDLLGNQKQIYHHIYQLLTEMSKNHA